MYQSRQTMMHTTLNPLVHLNKKNDQVARFYLQFLVKEGDMLLFGYASSFDASRLGVTENKNTAIRDSRITDQKYYEPILSKAKGGKSSRAKCWIG